MMKKNESTVYYAEETNFNFDNLLSDLLKKELDEKIEVLLKNNSEGKHSQGVA